MPEYSSKTFAGGIIALSASNLRWGKALGLYILPTVPRRELFLVITRPRKKAGRKLIHVMWGGRPGQVYMNMNIVSLVVVVVEY